MPKGDRERRTGRTKRGRRWWWWLKHRKKDTNNEEEEEDGEGWRARVGLVFRPSLPLSLSPSHTQDKLSHFWRSIMQELNVEQWRRTLWLRTRVIRVSEPHGTLASSDSNPTKIYSATNPRKWWVSSRPCDLTRMLLSDKRPKGLLIPVYPNLSWL